MLPNIIFVSKILNFYQIKKRNSKQRGIKEETTSKNNRKKCFSRSRRIRRKEEKKKKGAKIVDLV